jgi:hypothetical protein
MVLSNSVIEFMQYLYEMARNKSHVEDQIGNFCTPITDHIIKLLKWKDETDFHKHQDDIGEWFLKTLDYKYNKKRPDQETFYELLFSDRIDSVDKLNKIIKVSLRNYHNLPIIRTNQEVYDIMKPLMWEICGDLSRNKYKDFEDYYFPKYTK